MDPANMNVLLTHINNNFATLRQGLLIIFFFVILTLVSRLKKFYRLLHSTLS